MKIEGLILNGFPIVNEVVLYNEKKEGIKLKAVIDTGAYENYLKKSVIDALNLITYEDGFQISPMDNDRIPNSKYRVGLIIQEFDFRQISLSTMLNINYSVDFIIGNNFLANKIFTYSGTDNIFKIEW